MQNAFPYILLSIILIIVQEVLNISLSWRLTMYLRFNHQLFLSNLPLHKNSQKRRKRGKPIINRYYLTCFSETLRKRALFYFVISNGTFLWFMTWFFHLGQLYKFRRTRYLYFYIMYDSRDLFSVSRFLLYHNHFSHVKIRWPVWFR